MGDLPFPILMVRRQGTVILLDLPLQIPLLFQQLLQAIEASLEPSWALS